MGIQLTCSAQRNIWHSVVYPLGSSRKYLYFCFIYRIILSLYEVVEKCTHAVVLIFSFVATRTTDVSSFSLSPSVQSGSILGQKMVCGTGGTGSSPEYCSAAVCLICPCLMTWELLDQPGCPRCTHSHLLPAQPQPEITTAGKVVQWQKQLLDLTPALYQKSWFPGICLFLSLFPTALEAQEKHCFTCGVADVKGCDSREQKGPNPTLIQPKAYLTCPSPLHLLWYYVSPSTPTQSSCPLIDISSCTAKRALLALLSQVRLGARSSHSQLYSLPCWNNLYHLENVLWFFLQSAAFPRTACLGELCPWSHLGCSFSRCCCSHHSGFF